MRPGRADAGGKDGAIRHVMSGVNPQGVHVTSFKKPSERPLGEHDRNAGQAAMISPRPR
ncbi:MAG: hypothetical protein ACRDNW_26755 [Trebonia sp.]